MSHAPKRAVCSGLIAGVLYSMSAFADDSAAFFKETFQPDGWYFYVDKSKEKAEEKPPAVEPVVPAVSPIENKPVEAKEEDVKITSEWLRINLPLLLDAAQDDPSYENVRRYMYAQRMATDRATLFAQTYGQVYKRELALSENHRRPTGGTQLVAMSQEINRVKKELVNSNYDRFGVFFFFSSTCKYCVTMISELNSITKKFNLDLLPVSIDGHPLPGSAELEKITIYDDGTLTAMMPIMSTPTMYLINKETREATVMANGFVTSTQFEQNMFYAMRETSVISEQEYQLTKQVKDVLLIPENAGEDLMINEEELYENSDYLADKLRNTFEQKYLGEDALFNIPGVISSPEKNTNPD